MMNDKKKKDNVNKDELKEKEKIMTEKAGAKMLEVGRGDKEDEYKEILGNVGLRKDRKR